MNIKQIITVLENILELITCDVYDANTMPELHPELNWPSKQKQKQALTRSIYFLTKLNEFTRGIVYWNSKENEVK